MDAIHIADHDLERYVLRMVEEAELGRIEEHLFWCKHCLNRVEATERFVKAVRALGSLDN